jgi:hypothetical protein
VWAGGIFSFAAGSGKFIISAPMNASHQKHPWERRL